MSQKLVPVLKIQHDVSYRFTNTSEYGVFVDDFKTLKKRFVKGLEEAVNLSSGQEIHGLPIKRKTYK
ncbi:hypothetical protein DMB44_04815 [Thermoplasma sp. Kam2015]|nr:hypothetical protein DMB44_04815 [Thermoplasma sp. Kam2015]